MGLTTNIIIVGGQNMKAVKANKVYTIDETQKAAYLAQGYDITDDKGNVTEHSPTSTVSRAEYDKLKAEYEKLKAEQSAKKNG
jgi:hypothetical protein